ncbi:MAG: hypothetical protein IKW37_01360 [Bacteroidaceae bacterium]|nr:hypothetical protein [Bacteroidaceae bacterium]
MIGEFLNYFFFVIGVGTTAFIATALLIIWTVRIKKFMQSQKKIKWLCHHEYELKWVDGIPKEVDRYVFICRKCGKRHEIKIYNKVVERRTIYGFETMLLVHSKEEDHE